MMLIGYANYMMLGMLVMCVQYTSILITVACDNSDLNKSMRILALPIAMSMSSISNSWASIFGGKASMESFKTCLTYL